MRLGSPDSWRGIVGARRRGGYSWRVQGCLWGGGQEGCWWSCPVGPGAQVWGCGVCRRSLRPGGVVGCDAWSSASALWLWALGPSAPGQGVHQRTREGCVPPTHCPRCVTGPETPPRTRLPWAQRLLGGVVPGPGPTCLLAPPWWVLFVPLNEGTGLTLPGPPSAQRLHVCPRCGFEWTGWQWAAHEGMAVTGWACASVAVPSCP